MQLGGVQDAMMVDAPPAAAAVAAPLLFTVADAGWDELQVRGTFVIVWPAVSMTVGVIVLEVPVELVTAREIDCTAHAVKYVGTLLLLPTVAKMEVRPGTVAVAWTCPGSRPGAVVLRVATVVGTNSQLKTPTVEVMSVLLLYAVAAK